MKQIKISLAVFLVAFGIAASAYTMHPVKGHSTTTQMWYEFTGTDPDNPEHYQLLGDGTQAPLCNASTNIRCAVKAVQNEQFPEENLPDLEDANIQIRNKSVQ